MHDVDVVRVFYSKGLSVNADYHPATVLDVLLDDSFVLIGSDHYIFKDELVTHVTNLWKTVPDLLWEPQEIIEEQGRIAVLSLLTGTPKGDFLNWKFSGNKTFSILTIHMITIENGRIQKAYHLEDWRTALHQLH